MFLKYSYLKVEVISKGKSEIELGRISGDILEYSGSFENNYINIVVCCESVVVEKFSKLQINNFLFYDLSFNCFRC